MLELYIIPKGPGVNDFKNIRKYKQVMTNFKPMKIAGIGYCVPKTVIKNDDFLDTLNLSSWLCGGFI